MKKAAIFFADGMEECEALVTVDLLRRADIDVTTVSITSENKVVSSSNIEIKTDKLASEVDFDTFDALILPGGMPGTLHLKESDLVCEQCKKFASAGKLVAAICAAPSVLGELGLLDGKQATCYPGFEEKLLGATPQDKGVVDAGNIVTARALGSAVDFGLKIIEKLCGEAKAHEIAKAICY